MKAKVNKITIQIVHGDLLSQSVAAIVNATDPNLHVPPALAAKAGSVVQQICNNIGWCDIGSAVITDSGDMPVEKIIHAVGPRWGEGSERGKLSNVTQECLRLAEQNHLKSLAIPAISTGVLGYPVENCAKTMLTQIIDFTFDDPRYLKTIIVCLDDDSAHQIFEAEFAEQIQSLKEDGEGEVTV
jgi:O-acetyl-ADP-ribose deacetylase (regulator of RNase III)